MPQITDEMIEAGAIAWFGDAWSSMTARLKAAYRAEMRRMLAAALAVAPAGDGVVGD